MLGTNIFDHIYTVVKNRRWSLASATGIMVLAEKSLFLNVIYTSTENTDENWLFGISRRLRSIEYFQCMHPIWPIANFAFVYQIQNLSKLIFENFDLKSIIEVGLYSVRVSQTIFFSSYHLQGYADILTILQLNTRKSLPTFH